MADNFNLKKFLTENKVTENSNPYLKKDTKNESLREKIREMILKEIADFNDESTEEEEIEDTYFGMDDSLEEAKKDEEEVDEEDAEADPDMQEEPEAEEGDVDITDEEGGEFEGDMDVPEMEGDEGEILTHLMQALKGAKAAGDEKLTKQIGNTVTFLTRQYISSGGGEE